MAEDFSIPEPGFIKDIADAVNPVEGQLAAPKGTNAPVTSAGESAEKFINDPFAFLAEITGFSGTNFVKRAIKVIVGGFLLLIGLAHISGADNELASALRDVKIVPV